MTSVASVVNSFPVEHEAGLSAEGGRHFQLFCYGSSPILQSIAYSLLSSHKRLSLRSRSQNGYPLRSGLFSAATIEAP